MLSRSQGESPEMASSASQLGEDHLLPCLQSTRDVSLTSAVVDMLVNALQASGSSTKMRPAAADACNVPGGASTISGLSDIQVSSGVNER